MAPVTARMPGALATTWIGAAALGWPLYVTVMVPSPTGVADGKMAAICVAYT